MSKKLRESNWSGSMATLNYDRFLIKALAMSGYIPYSDRSPGYIFGRIPIEICLPHGSSMLFGRGFDVRGLEMYKYLKFDHDSVELITDIEKFRAKIEVSSIPPIMSVFNRGKDNISGGRIITNYRKRFEELTNNADRIFIIGMKFREHDKHIWIPIKNTLAKKIYYCSGNDTKEFEKYVKKDDREIIILRGYWKEFFNEINSLIL
ncbi:hypothetical protein GW934_03625, partial [Candidatus Falkowbacteria bacterium]|nr:hypothetical protein [Candidatus Falkowbacteria bacterium]